MRSPIRTNRTDFSSTVARPSSVAAVQPPVHVPRNKAGATSYEPTAQERKLLEWLKTSELSSDARSVGENVIRRNIKDYHGMTTLEIRKFCTQAKALGVHVPEPTAT